MTDLDYEPQRPKRHTDTLSKYGLPEFKHFFGAIACSFVGTFAGTTAVAWTLWRERTLEVLPQIPLTAIVTGMLALLIALPTFTTIDASVRARMLLTTAVAFGFSFLISPLVAILLAMWFFEDWLVIPM